MPGVALAFPNCLILRWESYMCPLSKKESRLDSLSYHGDSPAAETFTEESVG